MENDIYCHCRRISLLITHSIIYYVLRFILFIPLNYRTIRRILLREQFRKSDRLDAIKKKEEKT